MRAAAVCALVFSLAHAASSSAEPDIVIYAADVAVQGNWVRGAATDGAGGEMVSTADNQWARTDAPLALPLDVLEATFTASAGTPYHVWVRLRATGNSKYNDSVWVQFSDAVDGNGAALYAVGSLSALLVNLENCSACGVSGWGWQDKAYWLQQASTVRFAASGTHTIRIQTREDGVQIDQIVLSASNYLTSAPGQVTNDATIVAKAGAGSTAAVATPFFGSPIGVPGMVRAQDFDNGGEGVAYHDVTAGNAGAVYRSSDVDLEPSSDGGNDVGWVAAGEWLNYTVAVGAAGGYTVTFRVASLGQGGSFHLEMNGTNVSGPVAIPDTGGWQNWQSVTKTVTLAAGQQNARLVMDTGGPAGPVGNINSIQFAVDPTSETQLSTAASTPYTGTAMSIPGTIAAGNFDNGGEGVAYHDTVAGNAGGAYRATGVDLEASADGGYDIGWIAPGEWVNYTVNVASAGAYTAQLRVASPGGGGSLHLGFNTTSNVWTAVAIPATGGWQNWTTVNVPVTLGAGRQLMTLLFDTAGFNVTSLNIVGAAPPVPQATLPAVPTTTVVDGAVSMTVTPTLSWQAAGATSYDLRLSTVNPPATYASNLSTYYYGPSTLSVSTKYYWQVVARNAAGSTTGPVWSFTTEGTSSPPPPPAGPSWVDIVAVDWNVQINDSSVAHAQAVIATLMALSPRPQIVVMEEANRYHFSTYVNELAARTGQIWQGVFQTHCPPGAWNGATCTASEDEGVAIFTSYPVVNSSVMHLPPADCYHSARAAARAAINVSGITLQVFATHLQTGSCLNAIQARAASMSLLKDWAGNFSLPQIVGGDFNGLPDEIRASAGMGPNFVDTWQLAGSGFSLTAFLPSPSMKIDYWLADAGGKAQPLWTQVVTSTGAISDHLPVQVGFRIFP
jgi:endonuclease/exonuclease/phosphatase family metal-dependent hydrolase